jgi:hypothetical protein
MDTYNDLSAPTNRRSEILTEILQFSLPATCYMVATVLNSSLLTGALSAAYGSTMVIWIAILGKDLADLAKAMGREKIGKAIRIAVNTLYLGLVGTVLFQIWWHEGLKHQTIFG